MRLEPHILLLEDSDEDAELIEFALAGGGLIRNLTRVQTRDEFLEAIATQAPDAFLSDHGLPSFDGFEALEIARTRCPHAPFIFVTGGMPPNEIELAFRRGAVGYVLKSDLRSLIPTISRALANTVSVPQERPVGETATLTGADFKQELAATPAPAEASQTNDLDRATESAIESVGDVVAEITQTPSSGGLHTVARAQLRRLTRSIAALELLLGKRELLLCEEAKRLGFARKRIADDEMLTLIRKQMPSAQFDENERASSQRATT